MIREKIQRWCLKDFEQSTDKTTYISLIGGTQSNEIDWEAISKYQYLSEVFMENYHDSLNWQLISQHQILSEPFLDKYINDIDWDKHILNPQTFSQLSLDFLRRNSSVINIENLFQTYGYEHISQEEKEELLSLRKTVLNIAQLCSKNPIMERHAINILGFMKEMLESDNLSVEEKEAVLTNVTDIIREKTVQSEELLKNFTGDKPLKKRRYRNREQRCFELSAKTIMDNPDWTLVHGKINLPSVPIHFYFHAWVMKGEKVYDPVKDIECTWTEYQQQFCAEIYRTFTYEQMNELIAKTKHLGHWEDDGEVFRFEHPDFYTSKK